MDEWCPGNEVNFPITRTADEVLNRAKSLLSFIENGTRRTEAHRKPNLEYVFSYLMSCHILNGSIAQAAWTSTSRECCSRKVAGIVQRVAEDLSTPSEVVLRNPGISPIAMDDLLDYFKDRTVRRGKGSRRSSSSVS